MSFTNYQTASIDSTDYKNTKSKKKTYMINQEYTEEQSIQERKKKIMVQFQEKMKYFYYKNLLMI